MNFEVRGETINRMGIGSKVIVQELAVNERPNTIMGYQSITTDYGYASGQSAVCHFGLGNRASVNVTVRLPNGKTVFRGRVAANQTISVDEPE